MDTCKFVDLFFYWLIGRKTNSQTLVLHSWTFEVLGDKKTNKQQPTYTDTRKLQGKWEIRDKTDVKRFVCKVNSNFWTRSSTDRVYSGPGMRTR